MDRARRATLDSTATGDTQQTPTASNDDSDVASTSSKTGSLNTNSLLSLARRTPGMSWLRGRPELQRRSSESFFNPEPPDFKPGMMRSKRKASSPTEGPSKAGPSGSKAAIRPPSPPPVIERRDVFGADEPFNVPSFSNESIEPLLESSDDDNDPLASMDTLAATVAAPVARDPLFLDELRRRRLRSDAAFAIFKCRATYTNKLSAVLIAQDENASSAAVASGPQHESGHIRYLPLCPNKSRGSMGSTTALTVLPTHRDRIQQRHAPDMEISVTWPMGELPVELFDLVTEYLSRDDVKSMRLVNREFEQKVSRSLFHTSVVPFNTELYDMIDDDKKPVSFTSRPPDPRGKGEGRAMSPAQASPMSQMDVPSLKWQNAKEDRDGKVYKGHGLRVFRGFGPYIKRFGMSFEVSEKQMSQPLTKKELDHVVSYYGSYDWPPPQYARFANLAGLENTADETSRMKAAFANLEIVQELALSIDSGLGWLSGPDKSVRARIFHRPSPVFGSAYDVPDRVSQQAMEFWTALQQSQRAFDARTNMKEVNLESNPLPGSLESMDGLRGTDYSDTCLWATLPESKLNPPEQLPFLVFPGVVFTTNRINEPAQYKMWRMALTPAILQKEQMEWLLETRWAQQAFLESYMLAVIDNRASFSKVTTLNFAKISSRFLTMLSRPYFWDALDCLTDVTLLVSPDWRSVEKDDAGVVAVKSEYPSHAVRAFHNDILRDRISLRHSVKKLTIGWVGGGEHAEGMYARNTNIMPAPITQVEHCTSNSVKFGLVFKYIEHLTLVNCWISPPSLEGLVQSHAGHALKKLTLDSVSLTAHPKFPPHPQAGGGQQFQQPPGMVQNQGPNNGNNAPVPFQMPAPPNLVGLNQQQMMMVQQQWQMHFQQMQQMFQANQNGANAMPGNIAFPPAGFPPLPPPAGVDGGAQQLAGPGGNVNQQQNNSVPAPPMHWTTGHREGSWPDLLNRISPGPIFTDYLPVPAPWEEPYPPRPNTSLRTIELKSCGYVRLQRHLGFDQSALDPDNASHVPLTPWFHKRSQWLKGVMMDVRDRYLAQIVPAIPHKEADALQFAWGLTQGWTDHEKAEEATYDGCCAGGTGRLSGVVERGMPLLSAREGRAGGVPVGAASSSI